MYGRDVSFLEVHRLQQKQHPPGGSALPPPSRGPAAYTAALNFRMTSHIVELGEKCWKTPVSISGPGCSGSLLALADKCMFSWSEESLKELLRIRRAALSGMGRGAKP